MSGPTFWPDLINMPQTQATPLPPWPLTLDCNEDNSKALYECDIGFSSGWSWHRLPTPFSIIVSKPGYTPVESDRQARVARRVRAKSAPVRRRPARTQSPGARGACLGGPGQKTIKWGKKPAGAEGRAFRRRGATPAYKTGGPPPPPLLTAAAPTPSQDLTATPPADMVPATHRSPLVKNVHGRRRIGLEANQMLIRTTRDGGACYHRELALSLCSSFLPQAAPLLLSLLLLSGAARAQHGPGGNPGAGPAPGQDAARAPPPPAILLHRQALTTDGAFNFAFRAENGLQQGESIAPDGSRRGAYSYVDPNGRTISVRYTAGKDGFKVLEGEPSPGAAAPPQQLQARPQPQLAYQQQPQPQLAYQPQPQLRPQPQLAYQPQPQPQAQLAYRQPQQPAVYQTAAATPRPPPSPAAYQPAVRAQPLPYPQPVQHAQPPYQVQVTPRPAPPAPQGSLGLFRSTAPATFPQQQHQQQAPQLQQTPIEEPQEEQDNGPHSFGQGYSFEFQG
ncbi:tyrosine-protein phosphatase non-receptor type 23-like [Schistocerca americana]|uniref:tyrosine-protein phosphatase non-receptor type 23-like n=1 Tax=Schistocerca americana TaxID=7009 RepID=UPI001F4FF235|nr:tyrosine-protein phosphatase non-receptor type 23-like [Schistocerca americana]